ncbi:MAG: hypothetical protein KDD52_09375 [Bdellovibrionales bacterium]|nr:hypothetical protein [Bdellovibrionales bacterium]
MTFSDITAVMLSNMDFFQLRKTAKRYGISYQGVRRQKLLRDVQRSILLKSTSSQAAQAPQGAVSAKPDLTQMRVGKRAPKRTESRINTFSARNAPLR